MACSFIGTFDAQGYPGGEPRHTGGTWPDYAIATAVVFHLLAALRHRNRTGEGQWLDASMGETVIGETHEWYMDYFMNGHDRRQWGNRDDVMAPHNTYPCAGDDQWIAIAVGNQSEWHALCEAMGNPAWTRETQIRRSVSRWRIATRLDAHLSRMDARPSGHIELAERLQHAGVQPDRCSTASRLHQDRHLWEWGYWWNLTITRSASAIMPGNAGEARERAASSTTNPPPDLGEHNLRSIRRHCSALEGAEIKSLIESKVIY